MFRMSPSSITGDITLKNDFKQPENTFYALAVEV